LQTKITRVETTLEEERRSSYKQDSERLVRITQVQMDLDAARKNVKALQQSIADLLKEKERMETASAQTISTLRAELEACQPKEQLIENEIVASWQAKLNEASRKNEELELELKAQMSAQPCAEASSEVTAELESIRAQLAAAITEYAHTVVSSADNF
jgi:predicted RNase H-like nuclease (RuvC/YqgF family)